MGLYLGIALIAGACLVGGLVMVWTSTGPSGVAKSLAMIEQSVGERSVVRSELPAKDRLLLPLLTRTRAVAVLLSGKDAPTRLKVMLDRAGNPAPWTVERLLGAKGFGLFLGLFLGLLFGGFSPKSVLFALALGAALFYLPDLLTYNRALKRMQDTSKGLADALDMLTVCVEAGQGFDAALLHVARSIEGPISGEFARVLSEIQIGKSRGEAFSAMGERLTTSDVRTFVTALVQADRMGLPLAGVLREQSAAMREIRKQKAEEQAQKVTVKILFPLIFCIFPTLFIVVIGPGAIRLIETFAQI